MRVNRIVLMSVLGWVGVSLAEPLMPPEGFLLDRAAVIQEAAKVTREAYPDADQVLVNDAILEVVAKDGLAVTWDDEYSKILTEKGRRDASTARLHFFAHYGTVSVHRVELIKPDGTVIPIDHAAHSRVMTDTSQMGSNIYDPDDKNLVLSIPGIEVGDVCHTITVRKELKKRMPGVWCDYNLFEYTSPIVKMDDTASLPAELPLRHKLLRAPVQGTVEAAEKPGPEGRTLYTWKVRNVPQVFPEPDMPDLSTQVQRLMLSTIGSWKDISKWYWNLCKPQLEKITPEMRQKAAELVAGAKDREERIRRVFRFVSQEIRYMGITTEDVAPGYEPHDVSLTFKNRYGVCRDKAALLVTLLRLADIPAYPVLIHVGAKRDPDAPMPYFNHAITAVDDGKGGYILMDPTNEGTRDIFPAYLCDKSYLVAREEGEDLRVSEVYPAEKNLLKIATEGTLEENGSILLKTRIAFEGVNDTVYRGHFLRQKEADRRLFFERMLKARLPGAELLACELLPKNLQDTEVPLSVSLTSKVRDYPVRGDDVDLLNLPWLGNSLGYVNFVIGSTGLPKRRYPMETELTCGVEETLTLDLGKGMGAPKVLPKPIHLSRNGLIFDMEQSEKDGVFKGTRRHLVKTVLFTPEQYLTLKEDLKTIEASGRERPLFVAKGGESQDQELLSDVTEVRIDSPTAWTTTHTWQKRILTYNGKKKGSEVTIGFNPVWQSVEVVSATVSNVTGEVKTLTDKEINVMDAGWVGSAPRYPAAKTMVLSLPGVETGSVITVQTRFSQTNGYFYAHRHNFGGNVEVGHEVYRITYPRSLVPKMRLYNGDDLTANAQTNGTWVTWSWEANRLPVVKSEPSAPPWHFYQPTLCLSFGDWKEHAGRIRAALKTAGKGDREARRLAKRLVKGLKTPREKVLAIRNEVLRTIRIGGPSFLSLPLDRAFSTPDQTLADQYGHTADRALLLATMLDEVGFDAEFLLASGETTRYEKLSEPSRAFPTLGFYDSPIVRACRRGQTWLLNEGDQYSELGTSALNDSSALTLKGKEILLSVEEPFRNRGLSSLTIDLDAQGTATITSTNWYFGTAVGGFRKTYIEMLPEDLRRHHLELVGGVARAAVPASPLVTETKAYPGYRTYTVKVSDFAVIQGDTMTMMIPSAAATVFPFTAETRETPIFLSSRSTSAWSCEIVLPAGFTVPQLVPESKHWTLPNGTGTLDWEVSQRTREDGRICVSLVRQISHACGEMPPELYPALMEYNRLLSHPSVRTLVFKRP